MSYLDDYSKKVLNNEINKDSNTNHTSIAERNTVRFINNHFKDTPAYKKAIKVNLDWTEEEIEIREVGIQKSLYKTLKMYFRPYTIINKGEYIVYDNNHFLVYEFNRNSIFPKADVYLCNNYLNYKGLKNFIYGFSSDTSYGVKGVEETTTIDTIDGKLLFYAPNNKETELIYIGMRFIFRA